jgi:hypothetical protein
MLLAQDDTGLAEDEGKQQCEEVADAVVLGAPPAQVLQQDQSQSLPNIASMHLWARMIGDASCSSLLLTSR